MHPNIISFSEEAPCGLVATTPDGMILSANRTICNWLGYRSEDLIGKIKIQSLLSIGSKLFHYTHLAPLLKMQGSVSEVQLEMVSAANEKIPVLMNAVTKIQDTETFNLLAFFTSYDRSKYERELLTAKKTAENELAERLGAEKVLKQTEIQLKESNEQLQLADQRKDEFLATLAHELRNPLAPMRNVLEILKLRKLEDPQLEWSRKIMDSQVTQLTHLVSDLMEVSRITQGRVELDLSEFDISTAIKNAIESAKPTAKSAAHKLIVTLPVTNLIVVADHTRLVQMILNLLNNAIKYTPYGGVIYISAEAVGENVNITVRDTGIGIEEHHLKSVFQMFSQVESALKRSQGGLGIGLALVMGLAKLHNGTVTAASEGLGKGSEFIITLPLCLAPNIKQDTDELYNYSAGQGRKVLIIDDNVDISESMLLALELLGYQVMSANSGMKGIELAESFLPEIVLLDIGLPDINGYEVAKRIRQESWGNNITLIAATGWGQSQDKELAKSAGFDHHLTKPVDFKELDRILKKIHF